MIQFDEEEKIKKCLACKKIECDDCLSRLKTKNGRKPEKMHIWKGKKYTENQLCKISGRCKSGLRRRIKVGGVDFAMSEFRKVEEYKKRTR